MKNYMIETPLKARKKGVIAGVIKELFDFLVF